MTEHPLTMWANRIRDELLPRWREAMEELAGAFRDFAEAVEGQNPGKPQGYEHLTASPVDHTHSNVTHTSTKPPRTHRIHRRRTP